MTQPPPQSDEDDDVPALTGATAAALREFLAEAEAVRAKAAARAANENGGDGDDEGDVEALFSEDWGLSQFWYTDETAETVARAVIKVATERLELCGDEGEEEEEDGARRGGGGQQASPSTSSSAENPSPPPRRRRHLPRIACVACPSLFRALRSSEAFREAADAHLFEFDDRFARLGGGFSHYDYRRPTEIDASLLNSFDAVVADPPYLSAECLKKTAVSMRLLGAKGGGGGEEAAKEEKKENDDDDGAAAAPFPPPPPPVLVLLSGAVQRHRAFSYLRLLPVRWRPRHRNKLGNEFLLMTSSEAVARELGGFDEEMPIDPVEDEGRSESEEEEEEEKEQGEEEGEEN